MKMIQNVPGPSQDAFNTLSNQIANFQSHDTYVSSASGWNDAITGYADSLANDGKTHIARIQRTGSGQVVAIIQKTDSAGIASAIAFGTLMTPRYYSKDNGTWTTKTFTVT